MPASGTECGLPAALSATRIDAARFPAATGLKTTFTRQLLLVPRTDEQLFVWLKSPALAPATLIRLMATALVPVFESVSICGALGVPTLCGAKVKLGGEIEMVGAIAMPESAMIWGLPEALSTKFRLALFEPADCGAKPTATTQLAPIATVPPGLGHDVPAGATAKLPASLPANVT